MSRRVRATAVCVHEGKLLLVSQTDPRTGTVYVFPPGGAVEPGESPAVTAVRETFEETGFRVEVDPRSETVRHYDFPWDGRLVPCTTHFFAARLLDPTPHPHPPDPGLRPHWIPLARVAQTLAYHPPIADAVRDVVGRHRPGAH